MATAPFVMALPHAQVSSGGPYPPFATQTKVTYYQGSAGNIATANPASCLMPVGSDTLQADRCYAILTTGLGVQQTINGICTYTLYRGSKSCDGDTTTIVLPSGNGTTCIDTGVLDGGEYDLASGVWTCG